MQESTGKKYIGEKFWVSPYNDESILDRRIRLPEKISIHDVTLRDGEQTPGIVFNKQDKIDISQKLSDAGVQRIEVGMPVISAEEKDAIKTITSMGLKSKIFTLCRLIKKDIDESASVGIDAIVLETPLGVPKRKQLGWDMEKALSLTQEMIDHAKSYGLFVSSFGVDTTRADVKDVMDFASLAQNSKVDSLSIVDTFGCISYEGMGYLVDKIRSVFKRPLEVHTHNDFGLAVAVSFAAVVHGASTVHVAVNGIGERTGNASLDEIHMGLKYLYHLDSGLKEEKLVELSRLVEERSKFRTPDNKAFVGRRAFGRESGISVAGWANYNLGSEPVLPDLVGNRHEVVIGKKSGKGSIRYKLLELRMAKGDVPEEKLEKIVEAVKDISQKEKRPIPDDEFRKIAEKILK